MHIHKTIYSTILILLGLSNSVFGQKISYPAAGIAPALSLNADAVVRYDSTFMKVEMGVVQLVHKYAITILNNRGDRYAGFRETYSSFNTISNIKGRLIDAEGKQIQSLQKNKILDNSAFGTTISFHDDVRVKSYDFMHRAYPYTVEFEHEVNSNSSAYLPVWFPQADSRVAVERAVLNLIYYKTDSINFKLNNIPDSATKKNLAQGSYVYKIWALTDIPAFAYESYSGVSTQFPYIRMMAQNFILSGMKGSADSWQALGMFYYDLNKDRDGLSAISVTKMKEMTDTIPDTYQKVARLYRHLQENCRYVANEYGIAGWQTFKAEEVDKVGYGDCKGLSNYMKAMLQAIGIPSHLVLINAGNNSLWRSEASFVNNNFNHMILCVPLANDTIWLECTSTALPAGYLGTFTYDRPALLLTENGGVFTQTPAYDKEKSFIDRKVEVWLEPGKESNRITWNSLYSGIVQDDLLYIYKSKSAPKRKKWQKEILPFKSYEIEKESYETLSTKGKIPQVKEQMNILAEHLGVESGKRYTVDIPLRLDLMADIDNGSQRTLPINIDKDTRYALEYKINLPEGYKLESRPGNSSFKNDFVSFDYTIAVNGAVCTVSINFQQNKGIFPAAKYKDYIETEHRIKSSLSTISLSLLK